MMKRLATVVLLAVQIVALAAAQTPRPPDSPIFTIETDEFWLNLHHFLYVLGRAQAQASDASQPAVVGAPADAERALPGLTEAERKTWDEAVSTYAKTLSLKDVLFDDPLPRLGKALADFDDAAALGGPIDPTSRAAVERAAPIYRKAWWPAHRAANRAWRSSIEALVHRHGRMILDFITTAYGLEWPAGGYRVHVSSYANWAGAYSSTRSNLLVVSSLDKVNQGLRGVETIFHEAVHQWDNQVFVALGTHARTLKVPVPSDLPHVMIFFTVGEAVRRVDPAHLPTADMVGVWQLQLSRSPSPAARLKPALQEFWLPYLEGRGTRDEALASLVAAAAQASRTSAIFRMETHEFWLNLHHFLYVLGGAEAKIRDASRGRRRRAGRGGARHAGHQRGRAKTWTDAVAAYASGLSRKDPIFDDLLAAEAGELAALDDAASISSAAIP